VLVIAYVSAAITLLLTGMMAGFFFAYSSSVMLGLDAAGAAHAIPAMQAINVTVRNPVFFAAFFGMPVAALLSAVVFLIARRPIAAALFLIAGSVYFLGALLPTTLVNVPMNEALATTTVPSDPLTALKLWSDFSVPWTWWNTLRTAFSTLSLLLVGAAIFASANSRSVRLKDGD
jgi:uncharacterized membrane protein